MIERLTTFLKEPQLELKKVTWPTRDETVRHTLTVIIIGVSIAVFLGGLDYVFRLVLNNVVF